MAGGGVEFADVPLFTIGSPNPCNANITTWPLCIITGYYYTHKAAQGGGISQSVRREIYVGSRSS
jgi:hypothetical protein